MAIPAKAIASKAIARSITFIIDILTVQNYLKIMRIK
jgi:hypothetical protein